MNDIIMHPLIAEQLDAYVQRPPHGLLITGEPGIGKAAIAKVLMAKVFSIGLEAISTNPYIKIIAAQQGKAIGIDAVRELEHFMALKVPSDRQLDRIAFVEDAHKMTVEAQNALLKLLEEPPAGSMILMTATTPEDVLPTVRSRLQNLKLLLPARNLIEAYYKTAGYSDAEIARALTITGGLPGLTHALLSSEENHPLLAAVQLARQLLQANSYERLLRVDELSKQRELCQNLFFILKQMARAALPSASVAATKRWQGVLKASYDASEALSASAQPKLVLMSLMLSL